MEAGFLKMLHNHYNVSITMKYGIKVGVSVCQLIIHMYAAI